MDAESPDKESSFDWKDSCFRYDNLMRRVHSTPLVLLDTHAQKTNPTCCLSGSGKPKKLFVSFRQEVEEGYEVRPALSRRPHRISSRVPESDCVVELSRRRFHCNFKVLRENSLLFQQLKVPRSIDTPIVLDSGHKINPYTFWLVYQWMISHKDEDTSEFLNLHWVAQLYLGSKYLSVQELQDASYMYLTDRERVSEERAFFLYLGLLRYDAADLSDYLVSLVRGCFTALAGTQDFLRLDCEQLLPLLYSQDIVVAGEIDVFYAGARWLLDQLEEREVYIEEVMSAVRFHFMDLKQLLKISREFPKITGKSPVSLMIERAVRIAVLRDVGDNKHKDQHLEHLTKPRNSLYKPLTEQVDSYREFIQVSRRRREKSWRLYRNLNSLHFPKSRFVEDLENLYTVWKINSSSSQSLCSVGPAIIKQMSSTYN